MSKVSIISAAIAAAKTAGNLYTNRDEIKKQVAEARAEYEEMMADGKATSQEILAFGREVMDVAELLIDAIPAGS